MRASETPVGQAWLENFTAPDVPAATVLLDRLRFASIRTLSAGLQARLRELIGTGSIETPVMAVPERALSDFQVREGASDPLVAFQDFLPGGPMSVTPGSEGLVGRLLRDFAPAGSRGSGGDWIAPDADLDRLRTERCRSIVLATDYIGSGDQILALAQAIARHRTIRSWRSRGMLRIYAVAFAATPAALERLRKEAEVDDAWSVEGAPSLETATAGLGDTVRDSIRDLCLTETTIGKKWGLGWNGTAGLFVSEHSVPNNLPAVFWQGRAWRPLFPWRTVPSEVAEQFDDLRPSPAVPELAIQVGQLRIGRNKRIDSMPPASKLLLKLLLLISKGPRYTTELLAAQLALDVEDVVGLQDSLERLSLVDSTGRITRRGRRELDAQKRARRWTTAELSGSDEPYYPHSLR